MWDRLAGDMCLNMNRPNLHISKWILVRVELLCVSEPGMLRRPFHSLWKDAFGATWYGDDYEYWSRFWLLERYRNKAYVQMLKEMDLMFIY